MPEHEKRKARITRLLATVSVLGVSVGMFRPAAADDLTPSQQDKWMPGASSGAATPADVASPKLDSFSNDIGGGSGAGKGTINPNSDQMKYDATQGKLQGEAVGPPAVQNKTNQPDAVYVKHGPQDTTMPDVIFQKYPTGPDAVQVPPGPTNVK